MRPPICQQHGRVREARRRWFSDRSHGRSARVRGRLRARLRVVVRLLPLTADNTPVHDQLFVSEPCRRDRRARASATPLPAARRPLIVPPPRVSRRPAPLFQRHGARAGRTSGSRVRRPPRALRERTAACSCSAHGDGRRGQRGCARDPLAHGNRRHQWVLQSGSVLDWAVREREGRPITGNINHRSAGRPGQSLCQARSLRIRSPEPLRACPTRSWVPRRGRLEVRAPSASRPRLASAPASSPLWLCRLCLLSLPCAMLRSTAAAARARAPRTATPATSPGVIRIGARAFSSSTATLKQQLVILGSGWGGYELLRKVDRRRYDVTVREWPSCSSS